jgi:hypothetical protein
MSYTIFYVFHFLDNILIIQHLVQQVHHQQKQLFDTYYVPPTYFGSLLGHPSGDLLTKEYVVCPKSKWTDFPTHELVT